MKIFTYSLAVMMLTVSCRSINLEKKVSSWDQVYPADQVTSYNHVYAFDFDTTNGFQWAFDLNSALSDGYPYIFDQHILVSTKAGKVFAMARADGKTLGSYNLEEAVESGFAATGRDMFAATTGFLEGFIIAYDIRKGSLKWDQDVAPVESAILLHDRYLTFVDYNGQVKTLFQASGEHKWDYKLDAGRRVLNNPVLMDDMILLVDDGGVVTGLNSETGARIFEQKMNGGVKSFITRFDDLLYWYDVTGQVVAYDPQQRQIIWTERYRNLKWNGLLTVTSEAVFASSTTGAIVQFDVKTGRSSLWTQMESPALTGPVLTPNQMILSLNNKQLVILDRQTQSVLKAYQLDGRAASPLFMVGPKENYLYVEDNIFVRFGHAVIQ